MKGQTAQRLLTTLACIVFIASILTPFLQTRWTGGSIFEKSNGPFYFWSFRNTDDYSYYSGSTVHREWWFADFWSMAPLKYMFDQPFRQWVERVFITMLLTQILTIAFGLLSIIKPRSILLLFSTILSAVTIFPMLFIIQTLSRWYEKTIQSGFILTIISTALFLTALIWKITLRRRHAPDT